MTYRREPLMVSDHPVKFGGYRQCGSGDIILLVVEEQIHHCWFTGNLSKAYGLKAHGIHIHESNIGHKHLKQ